MPSTATDRLQGLTTSVAVKAPCAVAATANLTLAGEQTIAGVSVTSGMRVLAAGQTDATKRLIYVADTGPWSIAQDSDGPHDLVIGSMVLCGTSDANRWEFFTCISSDEAIIPGVTELEWSSFDPLALALRAEIATSNNTEKGTGQVGHGWGISYTDPASLGYQINLRGARSPSEIAAGVTPTQYVFDEGDIRRYGATLDGVTSDSAALDKLYLVLKYGGHGYIPPRKMLLTTQSTLEIDNSGTAGKRYGNLLIEGYGCEIYTSGAIAAIDIRYGFTPMGVNVRGLKINHRGNSLALNAVRLRNTTNVTLEDIAVEAHGVSATYAAFLLAQDDPAVNDTACFWTTLRGCSTRKRSGGDVGAITNALVLEGSQNATVIEDNNFGGSGKGIVLRPPTGYGFMPNGLLVQGNAFEGLSDAFESTTGTNAGTAQWDTGTKLLANRFESITGAMFKFVSGTGAAVTDPSHPAIIRDNYGGSPIGTYLDTANAYGLLVYAQDQSFSGPQTTFLMGSQVGPEFRMSSGNMKIGNFSGSSAWNVGHLQLGVYHYWTNNSAAKTYRKAGAPSGEADGTVVGTDT